MMKLMRQYLPFNILDRNLAPFRLFKKKHIYTRELTAGFADSAVLFPLLFSLSQGQGSLWYSFCLSAGILYIASAFIFRIPMPIQPLKSIAVGALAVGASHKEVFFASGLLGAVMLICVFLRIHETLKKVPEVLIHGLQASLGILLLTQSLKIFFKIGLIGHYFIFGLVLIAIMVGFKYGRNLLGFVALISVLSGFEALPMTISESEPSNPNFRFYIAFSLLLPQVFLTLGNSVAGTASLAEVYYKEAARPVTTKKLLLSIGIGNLITSMVGGLPFCHGAGGLTAHHRAGAQSPYGTAFFGLFLILLAFCSQIFHVTIRMDQAMLSLLLGLTGFFHLQLAKKSLLYLDKALIVAVMVMATLLSQDLLKALAIGFAVYAAQKILRARQQSYLKDKT